MTFPVLAPVIDNLVPDDGRPTQSARMLGPRADGQFTYIRVIGSDQLTLEPQFYGTDLRSAYLYGKQDVPGHNVYYKTDMIERREFDIRRVGGKALFDKRKVDFKRILPEKYITVPPSPPMNWEQIPDRYPRRKFLMKVAQESRDHLQKIGFTDTQIDKAAREGILDELQLLDSNGNHLLDSKGNIVKIPFEVHHCVPLQCGGSNSVQNLVLVDSFVHLRLFHRGDDPEVRKLPTGTLRTVAITVPRSGVNMISLFLNVTKVERKKP